MLIGREKEKEVLLNALNEEYSQFIAVYGRRRVGKTFLIRETFENRFDFQFTGAANLTYKIPCSGVISRPAASTSCRSFFITSAGIHLRSTLTVRTRLRLRTMSIGA